MSRRLRIWSIFLALLMIFVLGLSFPAMKQRYYERQAIAAGKEYVTKQLKAPLQMQWGETRCYLTRPNHGIVCGDVYAMNPFGVLLPHHFMVNVDRLPSGEWVSKNGSLTARD